MLAQTAMQERYGLGAGKNHVPFIRLTEYKLAIDL
jgi:hypothetical protein